jgi:hypothetical protein
MNASPETSGLVSVLWKVKSEYLHEEPDIKQEKMNAVNAFMNFVSSHYKGSRPKEVISLPVYYGFMDFLP